MFPTGVPIHFTSLEGFCQGPERLSACHQAIRPKGVIKNWSQSFTAWSNHLPWVEHAHNTLTCSALGLSLFEASPDYQRPSSPSKSRRLKLHPYRSSFRGPGRPGEQLGQPWNAPSTPASIWPTDTIYQPLPINLASWSGCPPRISHWPPNSVRSRPASLDPH